MAACSFPSLKTEIGLKALDDHLADKSFVGGTPDATQQDFALLEKLESAVDGVKFPHAKRWEKQVRALQRAFPFRKWPAGPRGSMNGVENGASPSAGESGGKGKDQARLEGLLPNAEMGKVCTRFPPEPSGYLHIGHAKAAMLNNHYARHYKGKLLLRFDDTNPSKEKMEFEENIVRDLATLQIFPDQVSHTSDYFEKLQDIMRDMLKKGWAYSDKTDADTMKKERDEGIESKYRSNSVEENLRLFAEMLKGSEEGLTACCRGKMDMTSKIKCLRDPVFYRCKIEVPHHIHGTKYKAYPTYDLACPIVDSIEGVTHALRTIEYKDRDSMYEWVLKVNNMRKVELIEFAKTQFTHTILSKRKLTWFVNNGYVGGWDDPRFPTVQGIMRRGMTVDGLAEFVMTQGMSKATNLMEWDKIWAINKQKIDPIVPRFSAVTSDGAVLLSLADGPVQPEGKMDKKHPKNDELGERLILLYNQVWLEQEDSAAMEDGEQITLLHWGNAYVDKILRDASGKVLSMSGHLNLQGNVKDTKKKVHWVPNLEEQVTQSTLREFDHIVTKAKIEDDDEMKDIINPRSVEETTVIGDHLLKTLARGERIQLERRGYYIVDQPAFPPGKNMVLLKIPDGKAKDMSVKSKVDPSQLQGGQGQKKGQKGAESGDNNAKGVGAAKAKAKPAGKPGDRPLEDISRLNIRVGRITKVWPHPSADKLYCEEIDLGEGAPRTIASGLRLHMKEEDMLNQLVIVLANLKSRKMQGFESQGMVLCAETNGKVELLKAPSGAAVGERVTIDGVEMGEADEKLNEKEGKAPLPVLSPGMRTTSTCQAAYNGAVWMTKAGPVTSQTCANGQIR